LYIGSWDAALVLPREPPVPPVPEEATAATWHEPNDDGPIRVVFSLISTPPPALADCYEHYVHLIDDMEGSDIIAVLALVMDQLAAREKDRKTSKKGKSKVKESIFVHCMSGVSRSATLCAALMLAREQEALPPGTPLGDDAVSRIIMEMRRHRSCIDPNEGFVQQLDLWRRMGCCLEGETPAHAEYRLTRLSLRRKESVTAAMHDLSVYGERAGAPDPGAPGATTAGRGRGDGVFRCRKCARPLFLQTNVVAHGAAAASAASGAPTSLAPVMSVRAEMDPVSLKKKKKSRSIDIVTRRKRKSSRVPVATPGAVCTSMFIEPMQWMSELEGRDEGKLNCPQCFARLGAWSRTGSLCSCGRCATPSFRVVKTSVDA
jgi:dual specificity phosphatase 12